MADRPIIFGAPMVRALVDGRKTMTRRVVTNLRGKGRISDFGRSTTPGYDWHFRDREKRWHDISIARLLELLPWRTGDRLWLREAWRPGAWLDDGRIAADYRASHEENRTPWLSVPEDTWQDLWPRLSDEARQAVAAGRGSTRIDGDGYRWDRGDSPCRWRPSIHMPRWASRLTLVVTDVRVERLQDISEADAIAEGIYPQMFTGWFSVPGLNGSGTTAKAAFALLWNSLHGPDAWSSNPWVAVISFDVQRRNIDAKPEGARHG